MAKKELKKKEDGTKKEYKVAIFNNDKEKILTGFKHLEIDLSEADHVKLNNHLTKAGVYIGKHKKEGEILIVPEECTLAPNQYKWNGACFQKLGTGFGKPVKLPNGVSAEQAQYLFFKAVIEGKPIPVECKHVLVDGYEKNLKERNEEYLKRGGLN